MIQREGRVLELAGVVREFPGFRLDRVSFSLEPGYVMGFIGPNGAGKTTTVKLILNLLRPHAGTIRVFGLDSRADEVTIKRQIGYLGERAPLPETATAEWLGRFLPRYFPTWDATLYRRYLQRFQVPPGKAARTLSKGTRTKLALAAAMAHRPRLLILDEPTSGLDPLIRHEVVDALRDVVADEDRSVLFSTHIVSDLESVADFITVINRGRILTCEPRDKLTEGWKQVTFRLREDVAPQALRTLEERFVEARCQGKHFTGVTGSYDGGLAATIAHLAAGPVDTAALGLEETFRYLVRDPG